MAELGHDQIVVELWPSLAEIQASAENDAYKGRLSAFLHSVDTLLQTLRSSDLPIDAFTDNRVDKGEPAARAFPPEVVELAAWLGSSGVALALYKALRLWVDSKNGRRIKIVDGGFEVEATQLSQKQFIELIETLRRSREEMRDKDALKSALVTQGLDPVSVDSVKRQEERRALKNAVRSRAESNDA